MEPNWLLMAAEWSFHKWFFGATKAPFEREVG
jgi:hypothetical protein